MERLKKERGIGKAGKRKGNVDRKAKIRKSKQ